ncbi:ATP-binding protein [Amycolatopsis sp. YIM 10]|uniref:HAMP domain-containing sensor histidine kinase n=1 Tax=Amycolatopsis sp. YIM 10 TaxID=2653857 RepID=UPI00128FFA13|nr:ATP-binding protein [Amycolatopsis sp. YIM 10]QFU90118.1 Signal transduction histidine-protein kinase BaeS [Amycolatopsis sp. YIM 10]
MRRRTIRVRLTALYSGIFLVTSTILLTVVTLLLGDALEAKVSDISPVEPPPPPEEPRPGRPVPPPLPPAVRGLPKEVVDYQWVVSAITIAVLTVASVLAGWWLAGRLLRPLRRITATAQRLSVSNLDERIALAGPDDELKELADTFDAMLARLERSVASQRRFVANAAHELRTPLATQRAAIQIGLEDAADLPAVREKLLAHNRRTELLIDSLLVLAEAGHGLDQPQPVRLDLLFRQVVDETDAGELELTVAAAPVQVNGDPVLLARLLANLLDNAVRYNKPGGSVHIELSEARVLTVRNTGPEVPPDRVPELFQPFHRLHTRTRADGAGLGLSIVASIAEAHGAEVSARPRPGGGLEVSVAFPDGRTRGRDR